MFLSQNSDAANLVPINVIAPGSFVSYQKEMDEIGKNWLEQQSFQAKAGSFCLIPDSNGSLGYVLFIRSESNDGFWDIGALATRLPQGNYELIGDINKDDYFYATLAWGLSCYKFSTFKKNEKIYPQLKIHSSLDEDSIRHHVEAILRPQTI